MIRRVFVLALILAAAGAPALAQSDVRADRPTQIWTTPPAAEGPVADCRTEIDCAPDLEGAPVRPVKVWSVRSSQVPPDAEFQPVYPVAIIADVDLEEGDRDHRDRDHRRDKPDPRRD